MIKLFIIGSTVMLVLDYLWLSIIAKSFFIEHIGKLMNMKNDVLQVNYMAAAIVYLVLMAGILIFVMPKVISVKTALLYGALFGFITYAIYDFTNLAILKDWPIMICLIDVMWGAVLCGITTCCMYYFCKH
jgi:uncharacterized membrane protein